MNNLIIKIIALAIPANGHHIYILLHHQGPGGDHGY